MLTGPSATKNCFPVNPGITLAMADSICRCARLRGYRTTVEQSFRWGMNGPGIGNFLRRNEDSWKQAVA